MGIPADSKVPGPVHPIGSSSTHDQPLSGLGCILYADLKFLPVVLPKTHRTILSVGATLAPRFRTNDRAWSTYVYAAALHCDCVKGYKGPKKSGSWIDQRTDLIALQKTVSTYFVLQLFQNSSPVQFTPRRHVYSTDFPRRPRSFRVRHQYLRAPHWFRVPRCRRTYSSTPHLTSYIRWHRAR